ncbi:Thiol-disulfide isomerase or thioredoxin [Zhouia amylolytica]|uniref:Thiol-disulfide isomerase or thioredoxin n=1 Tax=Zhouia amylolytica TaxID=376730 RepID=A0A1I6SKY7_9FLAO|nr:thioredoxin family protein [Zhouia amylolytica]SFS77438.1 Thiol-disulfide isomerase or thioredoxin [Zhouia amylolytica]
MEVLVNKTIERSLEQAISYGKYRELVEFLALEGKSSAPEQSESMTEFTVLNDRRMKRWDKTISLTEEVLATVKGLNRSVRWLVLTESWCGDAAHALPVMNKIAEQSDKIQLEIVFRDQHEDLMNMFLTNGGKSIPKLIAIDIDSQEIIGTWGPRPATATQMVEDYKEKYGKLTPELKQDLQVWYNKDKGQSIANELLELLPLELVGDGS